MKDRIKKLIINGMKPSEVATIVGCTLPYVSQLCKNEDFLKEIEVGRMLLATENTEEMHTTAVT